MTKNGRPVAVLLGIKDTDDLERILLANSPKFQAILDAAERRIQETGGVNQDDSWTPVKAEAES